MNLADLLVSAGKLDIELNITNETPGLSKELINADNLKITIFDISKSLM